MPQIALPPFLQKIYRYLFDFSANQNNRREVEDILLAVLAESKNDFDFSDTLRRVIVRYEGSAKEGDPRYIAFRRFMYEHERPGERLAPYRLKAEHLLEDLPRIFGDKKKEPATVPLSRRFREETDTASEPTTKEKTDDV